MQETNVATIHRGQWTKTIPATTLYRRAQARKAHNEKRRLIQVERRKAMMRWLWDTGAILHNEPRPLRLGTVTKAAKEFGISTAQASRDLRWLIYGK